MFSLLLWYFSLIAFILYIVWAKKVFGLLDMLQQCLDIVLILVLVDKQTLLLFYKLFCDVVFSEIIFDTGKWFGKF